MGWAADSSLPVPVRADDVEELYQNLLTCIKLGITTIDLSDVRTGKTNGRTHVHCEPAPCRLGRTAAVGTLSQSD